MYYILFGKDTFRSHQFLTKTIDKFGQKYGQSDIDIAEPTTLGEIKAKTAFSMFSAARLVVIKHFFKNSNLTEQKELLSWLETIKELKDLILVFWEEDELDKKIQAKLNEGAIRNFSELDSRQTKDWIKKTAASAKLKIEEAAADKTVAYFGSDLWKISGEIEKLICYAKNGSKDIITDQMVDLVSEGSTNYSIFELTDSLGSRNLKKSWEVLDYFLKTDDPFRTMGMIASQVRNLLLVFYSKKEQKDLSALGAKIHPYVMKKTADQLRNFDEATLKKIHDSLLQTDLWIKTGRLEPALGIKRLILKVCEK